MFENLAQSDLNEFKNKHSWITQYYQTLFFLYSTIIYFCFYSSLSCPKFSLTKDYQQEIDGIMDNKFSYWFCLSVFPLTLLTSNGSRRPSRSNDQEVYYLFIQRLWNQCFQETSPHVRRVTTVHNSQRTDVSLGIGMDKENMTYLYNGTVFSAKGEVLSFVAT